MATNSGSSRLGWERLLGAGLALGVSLFAGGAVQAAAAGSTEAAPSTSVAELVVTAQKRSEVISKVPMAVSALTGANLNERDYDTIYDFDGAVANLSVVQNVGDPFIEIRGVFPLDTQPGDDPSVAFHVNGIFLAHPEDTGGSFYDISRIEVLKGPQGTLYGRDAIGGAINVITNRPTDQFEASELLTVGNSGAVDSRTVLSGPLASNLFVRVAVATDNHQGYSLNLFNDKYYDDQNAKSGRFTLVFLPRPNVTMTTIADWHREDDGNYATHLGGIVNLAFPLQGVISGGTSENSSERQRHRYRPEVPGRLFDTNKQARVMGHCRRDIVAPQ